jgi:hypothetical protein
MQYDDPTTARAAMTTPPPVTGPDEKTTPAPRRAVAAPPGDASLSYKFQRLREKLRSAIASGELAGKLPGERALAKRFNVNAKTLSKALTDLAAEGLLDRSIGRGTYVKGSRPEGAADGKWLVVCDAGAEQSPIVRQVMAANAEAQVVSADRVGALRPSFVNQFGAVIDAAAATPEAFLRDLVVRNIHVVTIARRLAAFSTDTVEVDAAHAVACVARDLLLAGHRRLVAIEPRGATLVSDGLRTAAFRYAPEATIDRCFAEEAAVAVEHGATALACAAPADAAIVRQRLAAAGVDVPARASVAAVGCVDDASAAPCSGYYATTGQTVETVLSLLRDKPARPVTLWLPPRFVDAGTMQGTRTPGGETTPPRVFPLSA